MLRLRICPNCHEETRSLEAYFCHHCGAELSSPPMGDDSEVGSEPVETRLAASPPKGGKNRKLKIVVVATLVVALVTAAAGVYYLQTKSFGPSSLSLPSPQKNEAFVDDLDFAIENHPFSAKGLSEIVPANVDFYLEGIDPEILLPSLVSEEDWSKVEAFVDGQLGLGVGEAASFLEDEFAVIQESTASAFISRTRDPDFVGQKISEVGGPSAFGGWQAKLINSFLVVANSPDLIHKIEEAQKKLTLNLSLTSGFVEARQKLPKTGQIFYYGKKRLGLIPGEVKGEAFVISSRNGGTLVRGL